MTIDYLSISIGAGTIILLWLILKINQKWKSKNYTLPELKKYVSETHNHLKEANVYLQKLYKAFIDIDNENAKR